MHRVSNKLLMGIGALSYTLAFLLIGLQHADSSYWAFTFPGLLLGVVGADFEFCVANVRRPLSLPLLHPQSSPTTPTNATRTHRCTSCPPYPRHSNRSPAASSKP